MPDGKPAGVPCVNLNLSTYHCTIWNGPDYPPFCRGLQASEEMCGTNREEALAYLTYLEEATRP